MKIIVITKQAKEISGIMIINNPKEKNEAVAANMKVPDSTEPKHVHTDSFDSLTAHGGSFQ
nr:hypothetical protein [Candidatus Sigynarchaeum springense]